MVEAYAFASQAWSISDARSAEPGKGLAETQLPQQRQLLGERLSTGLRIGLATGRGIPSWPSSYRTWGLMGEPNRPSRHCR
jgi:hypothetical protein